MKMGGEDVTGGSSSMPPATTKVIAPASGGGGHGDMAGRVPCSDPAVLVFSYENAWTLPLMIIMGIIFPIAMKYRIMGKLENDQSKLRRGW